MGHGMGLADEMRYLLYVSLFGFIGVILVWALNVVIDYLAGEVVISLGVIGRIVPHLAEHLGTLASGSIWGFFVFLGVAYARGAREHPTSTKLTLSALSLGFALFQHPAGLFSQPQCLLPQVLLFCCLGHSLVILHSFLVISGMPVSLSKFQLDRDLLPILRKFLGLP